MCPNIWLEMLICSVEAKDQVGLELQHIADGVVYIDGIDGTMWVCCQKCKKIPVQYLIDVS